MTPSLVSAVPRDFFCEHASSKSRVLALLAHPNGPSCLQAVFTCRDAYLAQRAAALLSLAAANTALTRQQQATAHMIIQALPDAPAASFRHALEHARSGTWPSSSPTLFSWPADDPLNWAKATDTAETLPVSATRTPVDARLADLPGPVVRVVQLREFHVYDQAKVLAAATADGWSALPDEELGKNDPHDLVGAVMHGAQTTGELPGMDCLTDAQEGQLLLASHGDEVADWSAEPVRVSFGTGWRLRQAASAGPTATPDFASLFTVPASCNCREEDCERCDWHLTPRTADMLHRALQWLADEAYGDAEDLDDHPVESEDDGGWGVFARLPRVTWHQTKQWRRGLARACDDLAGDLRQGSWPQPTCAAEEMMLHLAIGDAPGSLKADGNDASHTALPAHRDDYDWEACSDMFFQDHDVLSLYRYTGGGPDGTDPSGLPPALHPDHWFEDFLNVSPRSPQRGFRR